MIEYLKLKTSEEDWHAVWDAAIDLYRIEAEVAALKGVQMTATEVGARQAEAAIARSVSPMSFAKMILEHWPDCRKRLGWPWELCSCGGK